MKLYIGFSVRKDQKENSLGFFPEGLPDTPPMVTDNQEAFDKFVKYTTEGPYAGRFEFKHFVVEAEPYEPSTK